MSVSGGQEHVLADVAEVLPERLRPEQERVAHPAGGSVPAKMISSIRPSHWVGKA